VKREWKENGTKGKKEERYRERKKEVKKNLENFVRIGGMKEESEGRNGIKILQQGQVGGRKNESAEESKRSEGEN
jgi:hypothetical protein